MDSACFQDRYQLGKLLVPSVVVLLSAVFRLEAGLPEFEDGAPALAGREHPFDGGGAALLHFGAGLAAGFTDEQQVLVFEEKRKLNAVLLESAASGHSFDLAVREEGEPIRVRGTISNSGGITVLTRERALLPR